MLLITHAQKESFNNQKPGYDFKKEPKKYQTQITDKLRELGHLPFRPQQPNGWSDFEEDWISPELIIRRLILALKLADYGIKRDYNFIKTVVEKNFDEPDKINQLIEKQNKNFFGNIFATICNSPEMLKA